MEVRTITETDLILRVNISPLDVVTELLERLLVFGKQTDSDISITNIEYNRRGSVQDVTIYFENGWREVYSDIPTTEHGYIDIKRIRTSLIKAGKEVIYYDE